MHRRKDDTMTDNIRIYRPPTRKRPRRKLRAGQERLAQAVRDGEADGQRWVQGKHRKGDLYIGAYFMAYFEGFSRAAQRAFSDVMRSLPPPILPGVGEMILEAKENQP
jgi:hypothetical protein